MATCAEVIRDAFEKAGALRPGQSLTGQQLDDGMRYLQALFDGMLSRGVFGRLEDYQADGDYTAKEGQRIVAPESSTITIPDTIEDEDDRSPYDLAAVVVIQGTPETVYIYDGLAGGWVSISTLEEDDDCPLSNRDRNGMAALLAEMIAPELRPNDIRAAVKFRASLAYNGGSTVADVPGLYY